MGGFAALLIGASDYREAGFPPLPFVHRDLELLDQALRARGFKVKRPRPSSGPMGWNFVQGQVIRFLEDAVPGATLLICLSGHGLHAQGMDYLVPEDLPRYRKRPWKGCVAIDWSQEVDDTPAATVLFLVDACREAVGDGTMGGVVALPRRLAKAVQARKVARLYACAPGGYAHFVAAGSGSFSLFSRAVLEVLHTHDGELTLKQLDESVRRGIEALHTEHGKPGAAQEARALTDADRSEFVVAGPLLELAPVPVEDEPPEPPADLDFHDLLGRALLQWQVHRRTERLEEYAVLGPTVELLDLASRLEATAVAAMWDAAARRRPVVPLLELVAALCAVGRSEAAHRLLDAAAVRPAPELPVLLTGLAALAAPDGDAGPPAETVEALRSTLLRALAALPADAWAACVVELHRAGLAAEAARVSDEPRPLEDLPPLLAALEAEELPAEVGRLVRTVVVRLGYRSVDGLLGVLASAGAVGARATALALVAEWRVEAVAGWLRSAGAREDLDQDVVSVVRTLVAEHPDVQMLPRALREADLSRYLDAFYTECAQQDPGVLGRLLHRLAHAGAHEGPRAADEDALAVVRCAAGLMRPKEAGELAVVLCGHGPDNLLEPFLAELCAESPERVAHVLVRVWELPSVGRPDRDPVAAAVSVLGRRYPAEEVGPLLGELEQRRLSAVAARFQDALVRDRSTVELLTVLARTPSAARDGLLRRILALRREPGRLAELLDACGEERFASLGEPLARAVVAECGAAELTALLAELRARNGQAGERLLRDRLGPAPVAVPGPLSPPVLAPASRERSGTGDAAVLAHVAGSGAAPSGPVPDPELRVPVPMPGRPPADPAVDLPLRQLMELLAALARDRDPAARPFTAEVRDILLRAARYRPPGEVAELLLALDGPGPGVGVAVDLTELLGAALAAGPVERTGALIEFLRPRYSGARLPGERLVGALRVHATALFAATWANGPGPGTYYLLDVFLGEPPGRVAEFRDLLAELVRTGSGREAGALLDRLGRFQPPLVVAGLLEALRDDEAFDVLGRAAAGRPVLEVAEVLGNFRLERLRKGQAVQRFVDLVGRTTTPDRCRALLVELLAGRQYVLAGGVLRAAPWTGAAGAAWAAEAAEELGRLFVALDARGEEVRGVAMDALARELSGPLALGVLEELRRNGVEQVGLPVLRAHARTVDLPAFLGWLNGRGWFRYAAALVDEAPPEAPVVAWYRQLHRTGPLLDRAALRRQVGADGPVVELAERAARGESARAALAAAALYREPAEVVALLAALADLVDLADLADRPPPPLPRTALAARKAELLGILAAARPAAELALILRALRANGRLTEAERIVDHVLADEPADRVAELLEAPLPVDGPTDRDPAGTSNETAELLAGRMLAGGSVAAVIGRLLRIGRPGSAETLATELSSRGRSGAEIARAVASLADMAPELSRAMTVNVCRYRLPEHVAEFLQYLDLAGHGTALREAIMTVSSSRPDEVAELKRWLEQQGHRELSARLSGPAEPPGRRTRWRDRRRP
ncbi:caspase family protein [Kitasatospora purpeofusca]|uniref:caspase family protein n=1 Tax=Kitasatospora purpeofusca TaxID=67352 RepID=UPI0035E36ED0